MEGYNRRLIPCCFIEFIGISYLALGGLATQSCLWYYMSAMMFIYLRYEIISLHYGIPFQLVQSIQWIRWFGTSIEWAFFFPILWLSWSGTNTIFRLLMWTGIMDDMLLPTFHFFHPEKLGEEDETSFARDMESMFKYGLIPVRA